METHTEEKIHIFFYLVLLVKLVAALSQVLGGFITYFVTVGGNTFAQFISQQSVIK